MGMGMMGAPGTAPSVANGADAVGAAAEWFAAVPGAFDSYDPSLLDGVLEDPEERLGPNPFDTPEQRAACREEVYGY